MGRPTLEPQEAPAPRQAANAPGAPYASHETPEARRRIEGDIAKAVAAVRRADPGLRSLVLTGGFARGEGTVVGSRPVNDYDFVAVRGVAPARRPYSELRKDLGRELGLHVDLAPVAAWRLPYVARTIFWHETAVAGRVVWGENLLGRIPVRDPGSIDHREAFRLLANRAAGLVLALATDDPDERRLQAAKALLAAVDVHLLAAGEFTAGQAERRRRFEALRRLAGWSHLAGDEYAWAFAHKLDAPQPPMDAEEAWSLARNAVLEAVPAALRHAGLQTLEQAERSDGLLGHAVYWARARTVPGARPWLRHPTARVRVAAVKLLQAAPGGKLDEALAREILAPLARKVDDPLRLLEQLRGATMQ